jgi:hypothetical protein
MQLTRAATRCVFFQGPNGFSHDKSKSRPRQRGEKSSPNLLVRHLAAPTRRLRRGEGPSFLTGCFGHSTPGIEITTFSFCRRSDRLSKDASRYYSWARRSRKRANRSRADILEMIDLVSRQIANSLRSTGTRFTVNPAISRPQNTPVRKSSQSS